MGYVAKGNSSAKVQMTQLRGQIHKGLNKINYLSVDFCGERKTGEPGENPRNKHKNKQQIQPTMTPGSGIEPGSHSWEASALATAPSLLPME